MVGAAFATTDREGRSRGLWATWVSAPLHHAPHPSAGKVRIRPRGGVDPAYAAAVSRSRWWCVLVLVLGVLVGCSDDPGDDGNVTEPGAILTEDDFLDTVRHAVLEAGNVRAR